MIPAGTTKIYDSKLEPYWYLAEVADLGARMCRGQANAATEPEQRIWWNGIADMIEEMKADIVRLRETLDKPE